MSIRQQMIDIITDHLNRSQSVDGYPEPNWMQAGKNHYRIWDSTIDLDKITDELVTSLNILKELRCGDTIGVDDPIDTTTRFSAQHRYVTAWIE